MTLRVLIRGAGDLATGVAHKLHNSGMQVIMTELCHPTVVRRTVSFAEAVFQKVQTVEGVTAQLVDNQLEADKALKEGKIPVLIDPGLEKTLSMEPDVLVDAIIAKHNTGTKITHAPFVIGLGPGFYAGKDVHAVIETNRGQSLGKIIRCGSAEENTGVPAPVSGFTSERVLRASTEGVFIAAASIGTRVETGDVIGYIEEFKVLAGISGVIRGLVRDGTSVTRGFKLGDIDPLAVSGGSFLISDKANTLGDAVLKLIMDHTQK